MPWMLPLPKGVADRIEQWRKEAHPGLLLDKYVRSWYPNRGPNEKFSEKVQRPAVEEVSGASKAPAGFDFDGLRKRRSRSLGTPASFTATASAPLTLHLSRASALENAGICLHPLYGFAYLPGSGLKGMARAFAETIWLPTQNDTIAAWREIDDAFGWAPNPDRTRQIKDGPARRRRADDADPHSREIRSSSGQIVFHDAWPLKWPKLIVDIVNNHHGDYYGAGDADNAHAPGDWENPVPVYFLAVPPGETFEFALAARRGDVPRALVELARSWLIGALSQLGAGAKTAAGYGAFCVDAKVAGTAAPAQRLDVPQPTAARRSFSGTLTLVTPAFLAGASQSADDCDLRGATLRGSLRWWWRTLHAGHVDVATLRRLEAAIWGDTKHGSPIRITVERDPANLPAQAYDRTEQRKEMSPQEKSGPYGIPGAEPRKTTQGLWYASYGMDEKKKRRCYLPPGCKWNIVVAARCTEKLSAEAVLAQAQAALWLLCHYGGVGSRGRKGFGSLAASLEGWSVKRCRDAAQAARREFGCDAPFQPHLALSPSLEQTLPVVEAVFSWTNVWDVLDQVGFALEAFAQAKKHDPAKASLGLPRSIHGPRDDGPLKTREGRILQDAAKWKRREWLDFPCRDPKTTRQNARHASPVHMHLEAHGNGYLVRVMAMPAACLPDPQTSGKFLSDFLQSIAQDLQRRSRLDPLTRPAGQQSPGARGRASSGAPAARPATAAPADWDEIDALYVKRAGQAHLVKLPDGKTVRVDRGVPPDPPKKSGDVVKIFRQRSGSRECRWQPPPQK